MPNKHKKHSGNPFKEEDNTELNNEENKKNIDEESNSEDFLNQVNGKFKEDCENSNNEYIQTKLKEDYEKLNNQYIRLAADFDNYRKRMEAQREELLKYGAQESLAKLIEVLDNFERAQNAIANLDDAEKIKESFDLIQNQTIETLAKLGLKSIEAQGEIFDPNLHEAVMQTPTAEHAENTIINELQKGYKFEDKVLRPTLVNVATPS